MTDKKRTPVRTPPALRQQAALLFAVSTKTVRELNQIPRLAGVDPATLERWAREDGWERLREAGREHFEDAMQEVFAADLIWEAKDLLHEYKELRAKLIKELKTESCKTKSFEAGIKILLLLDTEITALVKATLKNRVEVEQDGKLPATEDFSAAEYRVMSEALMKYRADHAVAETESTETDQGAPE